MAAFEKVTGKKITVPEHNEVTGAIGCAILALEENHSGKSSFKGWDLSDRPYELTSFECKECPNHCEIRKVLVQGGKTPVLRQPLREVRCGPDAQAAG